MSRLRLGTLLLSALVTLAAGCGAGLRGGLPARPGDDLRVTRAVLYQNGIGYFERRGRVAGGSLTIHIRPDQIADVLKSITVVDLRDGRVVSVALPVEKSQARRLADLPPQVREQGGILAILMAFRGARARVVTGERAATGRIVGVEELPAAAREAPGQAQATEWRLTIFEGGRTLTTFPVAAIRSVNILDNTLAVGLEKALDASLNQGTWKPIELTIQLAGKGPHDVVVSYVVEMPTWKPAYRVVVLEDRQALLQGWAVVDNVSGEDWHKVALSLTAGTPLAFTYDLYTPHYVRRPDLSPGEGYAPPPPPPPRAAERRTRPASRGPSGGMAPGPAPAAEVDEDAYDARGAAAEPPVTEEDLERNYRALVQGQGVGSLFRYDLAEPVTLPDRASALVSIVSKRVPGQDGLLFRAGVDARNPYRAVRLENDTGYVLENGPVAIYRQSTFLGEALVGRVEKGALAFVPYALDTRVNVLLEEDNREESMRLVSIVNGRLIAESKSVTRWLYDVDSRTGEAGTLWVQRARRTGWKITKVGLAGKDEDAPPQPGREGVIEEEGVYYVPIALPPQGHVRVAVEEETPVKRQVEIVSSVGRDIVLAYVQSPDADPAVARRLKAAVDISDKIAAIERRLADLAERRRLLTARERELRANLDVLRKTPENEKLRREMADRLAEAEKQIDEVTRETIRLTEEKSVLREQLAAAVKDVTLERKR